MDPTSTHDAETSKSQRKRDAKKLQDLAIELLQMPESVFNNMPVPETVAEALRLGRQIKSHGARKRQMLFIAKLLRKHDITALLEAIELHREQGRRDALRFHLLEHWREHLLENGDQALAQLCEHAPMADRQQIRQLLRNARNEIAAGKPPAAQRALFKILRQLDAEQALPAPAP
jgi:ribosome-associated protein